MAMSGLAQHAIGYTEQIQLHALVYKLPLHWHALLNRLKAEHESTRPLSLIRPLILAGPMERGDFPQRAP